MGTRAKHWQTENEDLPENFQRGIVIIMSVFDTIDRLFFAQIPTSLSSRIDVKSLGEIKVYLI